MSFSVLKLTSLVYSNLFGKRKQFFSPKRLSTIFIHACYSNFQFWFMNSLNSLKFSIQVSWVTCHAHPFSWQNIVIQFWENDPIVHSRSHYHFIIVTKNENENEHDNLCCFVTSVHSHSHFPEKQQSLSLNEPIIIMFILILNCDPIRILW